MGRSTTDDERDHVSIETWEMGVSNVPIVFASTTARDNNVQENLDDFVNDGRRFDLAYCVPKAYLTNDP